MKKLLSTGFVFWLLLGLFVTQLQAKDQSYVLEVKITNLTKGTDTTQGLVFTPILVAAHRTAFSLFELAEPAGEELAKLAEGGDTEPLAGLLEETGGVYSMTTTADPLLPGQSVVVELPVDGRRVYLSMASMLLPTNDGFIALSSAELPRFKHGAITYFVPGYDAGSEINDELCASIPGPHCGGEGYSSAAGEGKVHVHSGIHGVGELGPENYDWRNPVAMVSITSKPQ